MRVSTRRGLAAMAVLAVTTSTVGMATALATVGTTYTVTTTADIAANAGACGNSSTSVPSPLSLREATCLANNTSGAVTINIPAGTYTLLNGELQPGRGAGANVSLVGAGAASTIISGNNASRVIDLDANLVGGITNAISGVTITGGSDNTFGGAGIIAGSNNNTGADSLTLDSVIVTGNHANVGAGAGATNKPGGGIQFLGGHLSINNSTISNNSSGSSYGSGLAYGANGVATPEGLTITNSTFSGNSSANSSGNSGDQSGGALALFGTPSSAFTVSGSTFVNNSVTSVNGSGAPVGAAIWQQSGALTVTGSTFTGNSVSGGNAGPKGGAIAVTSGTATLHTNRFTGNSAATGSAIDNIAGSVNATDNWWGCNTGPGGAGCDTTAGTVTAAPRLVLIGTASPSHVVGPNGTSTLTASLLTDSVGTSIAASSLGAFAGLPVTFSDPPGDATVTLTAGAHSVALSSGSASIDYHSNTTTGPDNVSATLDNGTATITLEADQAPAITSANSASFTVGSAGTFTVTTAGYPPAALTEAGGLPTGVTFHDNGDGTATISGTPAAGTGGSYPLGITANNGVTPNGTQSFTLTVGAPPAITSASTATFTIATSGSFTVTTTGTPTVSTVTETGALPTGLTFVDNGNGTATLSGTPAAGSAGSYPVTVTATNGVAPAGTQALTIQVREAPAITTNPSGQTVQPGTSVTFSAAASGTPTPTVQWQRSTDGGASFTNIGGATSTSYTFSAAAGDNGNQYRAVFTNAVGSATTTAAALAVGTAPAFTSANHSTFVVGQAGSFAVTTSGLPSATLSRTGAQFPAWLTLTDNGDGTGALTGTPPAGSAGSYQFTLKTANGFSPSASQTFTLSVDDSPVITSANHTTFTQGSAGSFAVTTTAGFPLTTALSESGALPSGVTFHDNGDGSATLSGTPTASGSYPITVTATATGGLAAPATQSFTLTVLAPPIITSANHATFAVGTAGSFTVTTTAGNPAATTLTKTGTLPSGVTFVDNGDGTATVAGTPASGTGGVYPLTITASNGVAPDATQSFTLTVNEPPHLTSANHATFTQGNAGSFTVTTSGGQPAAIVLTESGALPPGMTFTDNGDGTATLGGTPTTGGSYPFTIKASNGVLPDPTQAFTATVNAPPTFTSADHTTFAVGSAGTFTVTTNAGTPSTTTLSESGALPSGVTFTDNGDGSATLSGTPAAGTGGSYPFTSTASNGATADATQAFTLTVTALPVLTSSDHTTFVAGSAGTFTVTTNAGYPAATALTEAGALPSGVTFTDNGDGTATLSGTPAAGTGGSYPLTITATNSAGHSDQAMTLTVQAPPTITSADHATYTVGSAGSFTVTTAAGYPTATTLSETGALPAGVTFVDNGNGTATLAGTPTAGTGGVYPLSVKAADGVAPDSVQSFTLTVQEPPHLTSPSSATFTKGAAASFTITTAAGQPVAQVLTESGSLPPGMTFTDNGDGTATLGGTPSAGGTFPFSLKASNGVAPDATQAFTATVNEASSISSADNVTFAVGTPGTFTVTTQPGTPSATSLSESGTLPSGLSFHDNGDGTATLAGTPAAATGAVYPLTLTAANGVLPSGTQSFTLTVTQLPAVTSSDHTTLVTGTSGSFTVHAAAGYPAATTLTVTGSLPSGVTFTDNGDGTADLTGTPAAGTGGAYPLTLTATNTVGHTTQTFALTVDQAPAITSATSATLEVGSAGAFTITTSGFPVPAISTGSTLPSGVTLVDNGNGTATLSGTPDAGTGGSYPLAVTAINGTNPNATQTLTLVVDQAPAITSAPQAAFTAGVPGSFTVTTTGFPYPAVTSAGALPAGVTFTDNGDGSASLAGTPAGAADYPLSFTAANGVGSSASQAFTLHVAQASQTVLFTSTAPTGAVVGSTYVPMASGGGSGNPVTFDVDPSSAGRCVIASSHVVFLHPGLCTIDASQAGTAQYAPASASQQIPVGQALTATAVAVSPSSITATVAALLPGGGVPTGDVAFSVDGSQVGSAPLSGGAAVLTYSVASGSGHTVSAVYGGSTDYAGSSTSTTRNDPSITAAVTSSQPRNAAGWYRVPVLVTFTCTTHGSPLVAACPSPVTLATDGAGQSVTRTIQAADGGVATAVVSGLNIDRTPPALKVGGVRSGATYIGSAPRATCAATDGLSGISSCRLSSTLRGDTVTLIARAADRAGNVRTATLRYTVLHRFLLGAAYQNGVFVVREGHSYTLVTLTSSTTSPRLYLPAPRGQAAHPAGPLFRAAGTQSGFHRYTLTFTPARGLSRRATVWNVGVRIWNTLYEVPFRPTP